MLTVFSVYCHCVWLCNAKNICTKPTTEDKMIVSVGDVRILRAVDKTCLHHHQDVIVFPRKGPRPHPDEMSGSDLDGDLYYAAWEPRLVPTQPMYEPMNYSAPDKLMVSEVMCDSMHHWKVNCSSVSLQK